MNRIASQCPYEYGPAVYVARALLAPVDTTQYLNVCESIDVPSQKSAETMSFYNEQIDYNIQLYPNPANDKIKIIVESISEEGLYTYQLFDLEGSKLTIVRMGIYNNAEQMDVSTLKEGIYILSVTTAEGNTMHKRISIVR